VRLLELAAVVHEFADDLEVHQRLAAEEVDLELVPVPRMRDEPVERPLAGLQRQKRAVAAEVAGRGEAVLAAQVAVVRRVQAHRLHDARLLDRKPRIVVLGQKRALFAKRRDLPEQRVDFAVRIAPRERRARVAAPFDREERLERHVVQHVHGAA